MDGSTRVVCVNHTTTWLIAFLHGLLLFYCAFSIGGVIVAIVITTLIVMGAMMMVSGYT
jgi:hypothetical protein